MARFSINILRHASNQAEKGNTKKYSETFFLSPKTEGICATRTTRGSSAYLQNSKPNRSV